MHTEFFIQLAYALGIGVLIGLERTLGSDDDRCQTSAEDRTVEGDLPGIRTFAVLSLIGFAAALVSETTPFVGPVAVLAVTALVIAMYFRCTQFGAGITTEAAAIGVCWLGMLCRSNPQAAGVIGLVLTVILASKRFTHRTVSKVRRVELTDTLKFLVVILFVAKLAKLYFGDQGLYAAAGLSGLADVDAITLSVAEQCKAGDLMRDVGALAITIAVVTNSVVKTGIAIYSGGWAFGRLVGLCLGAATVVGLVVAIVL